MIGCFQIYISTLFLYRVRAFVLVLGFFVFCPSFQVLSAAQAGAEADDKAGVETAEQSRLPEKVSSSSKVTIVVMITPTQADGSAWDVGAGADIVLCGAQGCYVSEGFTTPATFYEGSSGLRLLKKAGTCRDQLKCVFRGVELERLISKEEPALQIADVDYVSHTYLEKFILTAPFACRAEQIVVTCAKGIHRRTFSLWVMEEGVAETAGKAGLDYVLFKGLISQRSEALTNRLVKVRAHVRASVARFFQLVLEKDVPAVCLQQTDFLTESFYLAGLADAGQRRAEFLIKDFVGGKSFVDLKPVVQQSPQIYWAFLDIATQLEHFSSANKAHLDEDLTGLHLEEEEGQEGFVLHYGWQVKSRAQALVASCDQAPPAVTFQ